VGTDGNFVTKGLNGQVKKGWDLNWGDLLVILGNLMGLFVIFIKVIFPAEVVVSRFQCMYTPFS
jgi:hypothetical protein